MIDHGARQHAKYAASAAYRWMTCPGSVKLSSAAPPRPSSGYAVDGTEAHETVEYALRHQIRDALSALIQSGQVWQHRFDDEEARLSSVQRMIDYVYDILDAYDDAVLILEHRFVFPSAYTDECGGTNDVVILIPSLSFLYVIDFKHGSGYAVEVERNPQLMIYGMGAFDGLDESWSGKLTVVLTIVQPRAFHPQGGIREWLVPDGALETFAEDVDAAILECEGALPKLIAGTEQCRWCPASTICPEFQKQATKALQVNFATVRDVQMPNPAEMPVDRLAEILESEDIIMAWYAQAKAHAFELATAGYTIPGWKVVEALARRKFVGEPTTTAEALMEISGATIDDVMPRKLIGIMAAEKLVVEAYKAADPTINPKKAAEAGRQKMATLTVKDTSGKLTLARVTDRREAVNRSDSFSQVALPPPPSQ